MTATAFIALGIFLVVIGFTLGYGVALLSLGSIIEAEIEEDREHRIASLGDHEMINGRVP